MTTPKDNQPTNETGSQATKPDEATLALCEKTLSVNIKLHRCCLDAAIKVAENFQLSRNEEGAKQIAALIVTILHDTFNVATWLEIQTYGKHAMILSGFEPRLAKVCLTRSAFNPEGREDSYIALAPTKGPEFETLQRGLGNLIKNSTDKIPVNVMARPAVLLFRGKLKAQGILPKPQRITNQEIERLALDQLAALRKVEPEEFEAYLQAKAKASQDAAERGQAALKRNREKQLEQDRLIRYGK